MVKEKLVESPGRTLVRTVAESELAGVALDGAESLLNIALDEGILRDVPILGTVVGLARAGSRISEALFLRKLIRFLVELDQVPKDEREKLLDRVQGSEADAEEVRENLLLAIDRLDTVHKPRILAREADKRRQINGGRSNLQGGILSRRALFGPPARAERRLQP
jgi:hypothetical protein